VCSAVKILIERVTRGKNYELLLSNASSKNPEVRDKALSTLRFLTTTPVHAHLFTSQTFSTIINVLASFLPENAARPHVPHTDWKFRTQPERDALIILRSFVQGQVDGKRLLDSGLVTGWLGHYPFGGKATENMSARQREKYRRMTVNKLKTGVTDDDLLTDIVGFVTNIAEGRRQMRRFGLIGSSMQETSETWVLSEAMEIDGPWRGNRGNGVFPRERDRRTDSEEEQALRRRRRQAMVIGETGQPLSRENIFNVDADVP
jgi:hypothetical protein